jgi:DNA-binding NarL/FixJ family response regulator
MKFASPANPIRILTVDDHPLFREGLAAVLATQLDMSLVCHASSSREAIQQFRQHRPDITLMDLQMPDINIIILTTYTSDPGKGPATAASRSLRREWRVI